MVTMRRGTARRAAMAVAAISSGGATIAPSARATAQGMPGISAWATAAAPNALTMTRPMASEPIAPRFARRLRSGVENAAM
jgi:hypothetical protein